MNKKSLSLTGLMLVVSLSFGLYKSQYKTDADDVPTSPVISNVTNITPKLYAPYTGEEVDKNTYDNLAFMTIIENSKGARPQSGLSEADIVYETMAEGGIPRFIALFQKNSPKEIGPIRSARPYFINISKEYNLPFAHCGGSEEALNYIKDNNIMSINEMNYASYFWRDKTRQPPHNLYTSSSKIRELISGKFFEKPVKPILKFNDDLWNKTELPNASSVNMKLNASYSTQYELKNKIYYKSMDNSTSSDRANNENIGVKNIVIQIADIKLQADGSHLDIGLIGKGEGYVVSVGKYKKINWSRKDLESPTELKDEKGEDIPLSSGKTWWHIIDKKAAIEFK
jgi:hypothetical protein